MSSPAAAPGGSSHQALAAGLACYTIWGVLPLLFQQMAARGAGAFEIVAWRTAWSVPCAIALVLVTGKTAAFRALFSSPRTLAALVLSACLIGTNWTLYVWAVDSHRTLSASLGYYINPLLNMAVGALFLRERVRATGWIAIVLATIGVAIQTVVLGAPPWVSLALAASFCGYGVVRKQVAADAQSGLLVECLVLFAPALAYVLWLAHAHAGHFGATPAVTVLLMLGGPVTVIPLAAFAWAARRLPLTVMGFLQFIAPTLQFAVGVMGGEALTPLRIVSFGFIWAGVAVFAWGAAMATRRLQLSAA